MIKNDDDYFGQHKSILLTDTPEDKLAIRRQRFPKHIYVNNKKISTDSALKRNHERRKKTN